MEAMKSDLEDGMMSDTNSEVNNRLTDLHKEVSLSYLYHLYQSLCSYLQYTYLPTLILPEFLNKLKNFQLLIDSHQQLEKMQLENAAEWALREKLETEKLSLERENRRLKSEIVHVTEELTKNRLSNATNCLDASVSLLQEEINEKNKV